MDWYEAAVPALISNAAVIASFFDARIISAKVSNEIGPPPARLPSSTPSPSLISAGQHRRIVEMCKGVSSMAGFFSNIAVVSATAIFALDFVPPEKQKIWLGVLAIIVIIVLGMSVHLAVTSIAKIDERILLGWHIGKVYIRITVSTLLKMVLIVLNCFVFIEMTSGIPTLHPSMPAQSPHGLENSR